MEDLREHAVTCFPEEACALLVGRWVNGKLLVRRVVKTLNIAENKLKFFEVDPSMRIKLERDLRTEQDEIIGVFHSHPNGLAKPSTSDAKMIVEKHFLWLIAAVDERGMSEIGAFEAQQEGGFQPIPLHVEQ